MMEDTIMMSSAERLLDMFVCMLKDDELKNTKYFLDRYKFKEKQYKRINRLITDLRNTIKDEFGLGAYFEWVQDGSKYTIRPKYTMSNEELLFLAKLAASSRALNKKESTEVFKSIKQMAQGGMADLIDAATKTEQTNQVFISQGNDRLDRIKQLEEYAKGSKTIGFDYIRRSKSDHPKHERITGFIPEHVAFDNYYFHVLGLIDNKKYKFHMDWMSNIVVEKESKTTVQPSDQIHYGFEAPYEAFAYRGGMMRTIEFVYYGFIDNVKDKFPLEFADLGEAKVSENDPLLVDGFKPHKLRIKVNYTLGVKMWLMQQSFLMHITKPDDIALEVGTLLQKSAAQYKKIIEEDKNKNR